MLFVFHQYTAQVKKLQIFPREAQKKRKSNDFLLMLAPTYFPGPSPDKYLRRIRA